MAYIKKLEERFEDAISNSSKVYSGAVLDKAAKNVGTGLVGAPACGDVMRMSVKVNEAGEIEEVTVKTFGCGAAIASASFAAEMIKKRKLEYALSITNEQIAKELCLPPVKRHCSLLAEEAIRAAIADYQKKNEGYSEKEALAGALNETAESTEA